MNCELKKVRVRFAPSPTGPLHIGGVRTALYNYLFARQHGGELIFRIEDTDSTRFVPGAEEYIIESFKWLGIHFDEGVSFGGSHGPYRQSERRDIYKKYVQQLLDNGKAYIAFDTPEVLDAKRAETENFQYDASTRMQMRNSLTLPKEEVEKLIAEGKQYVVRFLIEPGRDVIVDDIIRGEVRINSSILDDKVLYKSADQLPTYHLANIVDDHLMEVTHVIRGEEWISSLPMHVELFNTLGWKQPVYCHTATLMKMDGESKRKLSKRKDPELALAYYQQEGISKDAVWEFLLTLLNSNYEEWRIANPEADYHEFPYTLEKMSVSGALVDLDKMRDISKNVICRMTAEQVRDGWLEWCSEYNKDFADLIRKYPERTLAALNVGRGGEKPRRDIETWKQACDFMSFYYDETFKVTDNMPEECDEAAVKDFFGRYLASYDHSDDSAAWFTKVKAITEEMGFAVKPKDYKKNPEQFRGSIVHITNMLRIALTGHANAPDIWEVSHVLGEEITRKRLHAFA